MVGRLRREARRQSLSNFFVPSETGLSPQEYAHLAQQLGCSHLGSLITNCSVPITRNTEVLHLYDSPRQKTTWLTPLLNADIRSCYAMT